MSRFWKYVIFFIVLWLLQVLLFDRLNVSIYVTVLGYVAFLVMLPLDMKHVWLLLCGALTGVVMDLTMGMNGLNTVIAMATAFMRPAISMVALGKNALREGEIPSPRLHGFKKWLGYAALLTVIHCLLFFLLEAFTLRHIVFTLLRAAGSTAATLLVIIFIGLVFPVKNKV